MSVLNHFLNTRLDDILLLPSNDSHPMERDDGNDEKNSSTRSTGNNGTTHPPKALLSKLSVLLKLAKAIPAYAKPLAPLQHLLSNDHSDEQVLYEAFLRDFPFLSKAEFVLPNPSLESRAAHADATAVEMIHVSSGTSGKTPTFWARTVADEVAVATRFEQIFHDAFGLRANTSNPITTLAIIAFPMGSWVGGVFTTFCLRYLSMKGYPITTVTPGNNPAELLRVAEHLCPSFRQTVILGYPPFVKSLLDKGEADWAATTTTTTTTTTTNTSYWKLLTPRLRLVLAGEVFSEEWRTLVAQRAGIPDPSVSIVSIYGTADAGVLANETPLSAHIRKFLADRPDLTRKLFGGKDRLPSLMQYDPLARLIEVSPPKKVIDEQDRSVVEEGGTLAITTLPLTGTETMTPTPLVMPLLRYDIGDAGGIVSFDGMLEFLKDNGDGYNPLLSTIAKEYPIRKLPFVWVFGRKHWTVSLFGANVFVENVMVGLEQPHISPWVTGKFVLSVTDKATTSSANSAANTTTTRLHVRVELVSKPLMVGINQEDHPLRQLEHLIATSIRDHVCRLNSEYANYVPKDSQLPIIILHSHGDPEYFKIGVKHSYV